MNTQVITGRIELNSQRISDLQQIAFAAIAEQQLPKNVIKFMEVTALVLHDTNRLLKEVIERQST